MGKRMIARGGALLGLLVIAATIVSACAPAVSQTDADAAKQQLAAKDQEIASLNQKLQQAQAAGQQTATLQQQMDAAQKDLQAAKAAAGNTIAASVPNAPPPPPKPTATALPAGAAPPPPPVPPNMTKPIGFYVDTVTSGLGESQYKVDPNLSCLRLSAFKRGMHIVWRMQMVDASNGNVLKTSDMDKVTLKLPNGETKNFAFARHGTTDDYWMWTTAWDVPMDYPLGSIDYSIEATTKSGTTGTFKEIPVNGSTLMVVQ